MMKTYKLILFTLIVLLFGACRKDAPELQNPKDQKILTTPSQIFSSFWHGMNNSYAFWSIDPTDWDQVYDEYLPKFQALDPMEVVSSQQLTELYTAITKNLIDHHYSVTITNYQAAENDENQIWISPGDIEVKSRNYYHGPITFDVLKPIIQGFKTQGRIEKFEGGENKNNSSAASYNIDNGIIYIYLSDFKIAALRRTANPKTDPVLMAVDYFQQMILTTKNIRGVVIDVRSNSGGYLSDMHEIVAPLLSEKQLFGHSRSKNGIGRLDYGPWVPLIITPTTNHRSITAPIVVLADIQSISMAELTAMVIQSLPNGYVIGERTWGGTGPLDGDYNATYGGSFKNAAVDVYTSTSIVKDIHENIIEGYGVTPDIEVFYDDKALTNGTDPQLERALSFIKNPQK